MQKRQNGWIAGLVFIIALVSVPVWYFTKADDAVRGQIPDSPWDGVPRRAAPVDHSALMEGPFETGKDVTVACLECHEDAARQVMQTPHWTWESAPVELEGRDEPVVIGKKNAINNFCIGIQGNWDSCTACHAGYGWADETFDFGDEANVDCLVCHDNSGGYIKSKAGLPAAGVDLLAAAKSVALPTRENCGSCHFRGGGGDAVKHGDLDESLYYPEDHVDVHMGRYDFQCIDCHKTEDHLISGRSISVSVDNENQIACTDCHAERLHADQRINAHTESVACQTCHIPEVAVHQATKTHWDWSTAGDDEREEATHEYLKIKGSFVYEKNLKPEFVWYNGHADRYLLGDPVAEEGITALNPPKGDIRDPEAKIWPFKVHRAMQPYDTENRYLMQPVTAGEGGFWREFNWDQAIQLGSEVTGMDYSGEFGFAATSMYWPQTHMVAPKEQALQCKACHCERGCIDWEAIGYPGDPLKWGSRNRIHREDLAGAGEQR
ncbi:MAG: tetrathionate reductase family octaheme c-type cytochrome [Xanthomonadales bacterium]|jgi:octaheme c-type cytochrome (tetrathionate reductase family)|nr:tetrathionate reductase family octaheme c-type cytochrome [Xanthomonadales bacterium]